eukprot:6467925-Amphidinium_carterae.1
MEDWECLNCSALPPELTFARAPPCLQECPSISVCKQGRRTPLLQHSASKGFPNMTKQRLEELYLLLECKTTPRPSTLADYLTAVIEKVLPSKSKEEVEGIVRSRTGPERSKPEQPPVHRDDDATDICAPFEEVLDDEDAAVLRAALKQKRLAEVRKRTVEEDRVAAAADSSSRPKPLPKVAAPRRGPLPEERRVYTHDLEGLRSLMPAGSNCKLYRETNYHTRFRVCYDSSLKTKCWGRLFSEREAAIFVLRWLWEKHLAATGVACAFDLEASVVEPLE